MRPDGGRLTLPSALPPRPRLKGRRDELETLEAAITGGHLPRLALIGGGGSGKSVLAAALVHRLMRDPGRVPRPPRWAPTAKPSTPDALIQSRRYPGGAAWFRIGDWDHRTLLQMVALWLRVPREPLVDSVRGGLIARGPALVVLDNHENDRALARFFEALEGTPVTWLVTARRCLLSGVAVFPVVAPLVQSRRSAFPAVRALTSLLRWNPLALDIADALVGTGAIAVPALRDWLLAQGVTGVRVMAHEDDVTEVRLLADWAWARLPDPARRMLLVLAHCPGDHMDAVSLAQLGGVRRGGTKALARLRAWRLVQEPWPGRFALHAVVRYALSSKGDVRAERYFDHYVTLIERHPERFTIEQSHIFAAMDHAQTVASLEKILRLEALL